MGKIGYTNGAISIMVIFFVAFFCLIAYTIDSIKHIFISKDNVTLTILLIILSISSILIACIPFYYKVPAIPIVHINNKTIKIMNKSDYFHSDTNLFTVSDIKINCNKLSDNAYHINNINKNQTDLSWNNVNVSAAVATVRIYNNFVYSESDQFNII
jgi:hypothetical protein